MFVLTVMPREYPPPLSASTPNTQPDRAIAPWSATMAPKRRRPTLLIVPSLVTNLWQLAIGGRLGPLLRRLWTMMAGICLGTWAGVLFFSAPSRAVVEEFARTDPYVTGGLVTQWVAREWTTVVGAGAANPLPPGL